MKMCDFVLKLSNDSYLFTRKKEGLSSKSGKNAAVNSEMRRLAVKGGKSGG